MYHSKGSINSVEPRIHAITDLDYNSLKFFLNKTCVSIDISRYIVLVNNVEPVLLAITDLANVLFKVKLTI